MCVCEWMNRCGRREPRGRGEVGAVRLNAASARQAGVSSGARRENRLAWWSVAVQEEPWHLSSLDGGHPQKSQASATLSCLRLQSSHPPPTIPRQRGRRLMGRDNGHRSVDRQDELLSERRRGATWCRPARRPPSRGYGSVAKLQLCRSSLMREWRRGSSLWRHLIQTTAFSLIASVNYLASNCFYYSGDGGNTVT